jgi:hypothetical protein
MLYMDRIIRRADIHSGLPAPTSDGIKCVFLTNTHPATQFRQIIAVVLGILRNIQIHPVQELHTFLMLKLAVYVTTTVF